MMLLLPGNAKALLDALDGAQCGSYGWLLTPSRTMTNSDTAGLRYAIDNECFTRQFDGNRYTAAIERIVAAHGAGRCLFAAAPDVVADASATLTLAEEWLPKLRTLGVPAALVAQDGLEKLPIPWDEFDTLFVGGSTAWKLGHDAALLLDQARQRGKWTHVGRVNSVRRASRLLVYPDSVDGTAWAKHPPSYARHWRSWVQNGSLQQKEMDFGQSM